MAVTGMTVFTVTRDQIITQALQHLGVLEAGQAPNANDLATMSFILNMYIKACAASGIPIWAIQTIPVPLVVGQIPYTIGKLAGANVNTNRPIKVYQAYLQDPNAGSNPVQQISKQEYDFLSFKATPGIPNQFYYNPTLDNGTLFVFPVTSIAGYTLNVSVQRQLYDMTAGADNFDFPQEGFLMLSFVLAREGLATFQVSERTERLIMAGCDRWERPFWDFEQEEADTMFSPDSNG